VVDHLPHVACRSHDRSDRRGRSAAQVTGDWQLTAGQCPSA